MALSNIWTLTAGVTQTCAAWGIVRMSRRREFGVRTGEVRFTVHQDADTPLPFAYKEPVTILRNGVPWFVGLVTKTPRMASPTGEQIDYIISDPWWYLEQSTFQQQWAQLSGSGGATTLLSTTKSRANLGQANISGGVSLNLGQVMREVLYYVLYSAQGIAFPSTVDASGLPTAPSMTAGPFQIGTLSPSITEPYFEVRDLTCAEVMEKLMRYLPDTGKWFDFTTTPPTLNIDNRANLAAKTISVLGGTVTSKFNPTPRPDLQVPVVLCKYESTSTVDGQARSNLIVDQYPPGVLDNAVGAFVRTVDLIGGNATFQKQNVVVCDAPRTEADSVALSWVTNNPLLFWLFGSVTYPPSYDAAGISLQSVTTSLNKTDPNNTTPQAGFSLGALTEQLLTGAITQWMIDNGMCVAAKVVKRVVLTYSGSDTATKNLFNFNPNTPNTLSIDLGCVCTNASTKIYEQLVSYFPGESAPTGNAQALYNALAALHQQGTIEMAEDECSDLLPPGFIFNTTDGLTEWKTMNALILSVTEDIDRGRTTVEFGPTLFLGLEEMVELYRANRGRLFASGSQQRTSGVGGDGNSVIGHAYSPENTFAIAPGGGGSSAPWAPQIINTAALGDPPTYVIKINTGILLQPTGPKNTIAVSNLNTQLAFNASGDFVYLEGPVTSLACSSATVKIGSTGGTFDPTIPYPWATSQAYLANDGATPPNQTFWRVLLCTIAPNASGVPVATPCCVTNLQLFNENQGGEPDIYPYPPASAST